MTKAQYLSLAATLGFSLKDALLLEISMVSEIVRERNESMRKGGKQ